MRYLKYQTRRSTQRYRIVTHISIIKRNDPIFVNQFPLFSDFRYALGIIAVPAIVDKEQDPLSMRLRDLI